MVNMPKLNDKKRIVIITQGEKSVIYSDKNGQIKEFEVPKIDPEKIVDTVIMVYSQLMR
jgi:sugar/nucleoside kinase (ribokinase family)